MAKKEKKIEPGHSALGIVGGSIAGPLIGRTLAIGVDKYEPFNPKPKPNPKPTAPSGTNPGRIDLMSFFNFNDNKKISPSELPTDSKRVWNQTVKDYGLKDVKLEHIKPGRIGSHYDPINKIVRTKNVGAYDTLAHELGHAADLRKFPKLKMALRTVAPGVGLLSGGVMMFAKDENIKEKAPLALAAGGAPVIYQEAKASTIGMKEMVKSLGWRKALKGGSKLLPALGSYVFAVGGPAIGMHIANKLSKKK